MNLFSKFIAYAFEKNNDENNVYINVILLSILTLLTISGYMGIVSEDFKSLYSFYWKYIYISLFFFLSLFLNLRLIKYIISIFLITSFILFMMYIIRYMGHSNNITQSLITSFMLFSTYSYVFFTILPLAIIAYICSFIYTITLEKWTQNFQKRQRLNFIFLILITLLSITKFLSYDTFHKINYTDKTSNHTLLDTRQRIYKDTLLERIAYLIYSTHTTINMQTITNMNLHKDLFKFEKNKLYHGYGDEISIENNASIIKVTFHKMPSSNLCIKWHQFCDSDLYGFNQYSINGEIFNYGTSITQKEIKYVEKTCYKQFVNDITFIAPIAKIKDSHIAFRHSIINKVFDILAQDKNITVGTELKYIDSEGRTHFIFKNIDMVSSKK